MLDFLLRGGTLIDGTGSPGTLTDVGIRDGKFASLGATEEEALENVKEAIGVYLESLSKHGDPIPVGPDLTVHKEERIEVPIGAFRQNVTIPWPSLSLSGAS